MIKIDCISNKNVRCTLAAPFGDGVERILGPEKGIRGWVSRTPFVPPRYLKRRGRHTLEGQTVEPIP